MPTFEIEESYKHLIVAGVDEVGIGPLAGPIVACACIVVDRKLPDHLIKVIDDSKKLPLKKREEIFEMLENNPNFITGISIVQSSIIDECGLSHAWRMCVSESIRRLRIKPNVCIIDGNRNIDLNDIKTECIIKGDQISYSIAAASIIAKVTRDRIMREIHKTCPEYGFDKHVGYGTKAHMEALKKYGPSRYHRKSYAPVAKLL